jgi:hypothetical protein
MLDKFKDDSERLRMNTLAINYNYETHKGNSIIKGFHHNLTSCLSLRNITFQLLEK